MGEQHVASRSNPTSGSVYEISSDEDDLAPFPRRLTRAQRSMETRSRTLQQRNLEVLFSVQESDSIKTHTELLNSWLTASQEVQALITKSKDSKFGSSSDTHRILVVDLGDLGAQFWECFEAACLEDSDSAHKVVDDLSFLITRRFQRLGLTKQMLDIRVSRILHHVESLKPYNRNNMEMFFNKSAMPNWQLWEELMTLLDMDTLDMKSVEENEDWLLKLIDQAPATLSKEQFHESKLLSLRMEFLECKAFEAKLVSQRLDKTEEEYKILKARKKEQHALHQLTVFDISYSKLTDFRRFHERAPQISIEVCFQMHTQASSKSQILIIMIYTKDHFVTRFLNVLYR
jgi:hypothetical protein